eukprot:SM000053S17448  [mRNA]  locus=s53:433545:435446:+ [translate_table: standard]
MALLERQPVPTKAVTACFLNGVADLFCQLAVEKQLVVDVRRLAGFCGIGLFLVGPALHYWYGTLGRVINLPGTKGVVARLILDQVIFSPLSIGAFFAILLTLEGRTDDILFKLKRDWLTAVLASWKLWVPFQTLNFALIPPQLQVAAANIIGLVWTIYISFAAHT